MQSLRLDYNRNRVLSYEPLLSPLHIHVFVNQLLSLLRHNCVDIIFEVVIYMILVLLGAIGKLWPLNFGQCFIFLTCIEIADVTCERVLSLWGHHLLLCKPFLKIASMLLSTRTSIHITYFLGAAWLHKSVWLELSRSRLQRTLRCLNSLRRVLRLLILLLILWVSNPSIWHLLLAGHVYLIILLRNLWLIVHLWVTLMHHTLTSSL